MTEFVYDAYYNYTSDFGPGIFSCISGEVIGDTIKLYNDVAEITIRKQGEGYNIISFEEKR